MSSFPHDFVGFTGTRSDYTGAGISPRGGSILSGGPELGDLLNEPNDDGETMREEALTLEYWEDEGWLSVILSNARRSPAKEKCWRN